MKNLIVAMACLLAACGGSTSKNDPAAALIAGMDVHAIEGNVRMFLTDAPAEYDAVWVTISRVEVERTEGELTQWITLVAAEQIFDLLKLRNDVTAVMGDTALEPGKYGQLRMIVSEAAVEKAGMRTPLKIPSGSQTGIKIDLNLEIVAGNTYVVVTDFDAAKSIKETGAGLLMAPVIHVELLGTVNEAGDVAALYVRDATTEEGADADAGRPDGAGEAPDRTDETGDGGSDAGSGKGAGDNGGTGAGETGTGAGETGTGAGETGTGAGETGTGTGETGGTSPVPVDPPATGTGG